MLYKIDTAVRQGRDLDGEILERVVVPGGVDQRFVLIENLRKRQAERPIARMRKVLPSPAETHEERIDRPHNRQRNHQGRVQAPEREEVIL